MRIAFLALAQAHQHLHWLPAALELSRRPGVRVDVLCPSLANLRFIRCYDPDRRLRLIWIPARLRDGLFDLPPRKRVQKLYAWLFRRYPVLVTTETTSTRLKDDPRFRSRLIRIRHGAGDAATRLDDPRVRKFDLTLVGGEKDKRRLVAAGLASPENVIVTGYPKFELVRPPERLFPNDRPIALYNPHSRPDLSSWFEDGPALVREMEKLTGWNFIVAPHVKIEGGPEVRSDAANILIDRGSVRSIDMSYTQSASVYIGDASSQLYEFLIRPRPCIFLNSHKLDWQGREEFAHFRLGQVIDRPDQLGEALHRAMAVQPEFEPLQLLAMRDTIDTADRPASQRQADVIAAYVQNG